MNEVVLPELGEGIEDAKIACWHVQVGDKVAVDDDIVEMITDKATFNVSSGHVGIVKKILLQEGEEAKIGQTLAIIEPENN